ncbi:hypothetical protein DIPPA_11569 [Diplonema papillatum]|nr:hypothetical protein DIPPA_11569 [Diplonema papillatum]
MAIRSCLVTAVVAALASPVSATWHHGGPASPPVSDELLAARQKYALTFEDSQLKGFPMLRNMPPPEDITSNPYFLQYLMQKRDNPFRPLPPLPDFIIAVLTNASESPAQKALLGQVIYSIFDSFTTYRPEAGGRPNQTGGYDDMFAVGYETLPVAVGEVFSDEAFSRDRLSGPLPFALRKATWRLLAQMRLLASARSELIAKAVFALLCGRFAFCL